MKMRIKCNFCSNKNIGIIPLCLSCVYNKGAEKWGDNLKNHYRPLHYPEPGETNNKYGGTE